jgi:hypothetical protein
MSCWQESALPAWDAAATAPSVTVSARGTRTDFRHAGIPSTGPHSVNAAFMLFQVRALK